MCVYIYNISSPGPFTILRSILLAVRNPREHGRGGGGVLSSSADGARVSHHVLRVCRLEEPLNHRRVEAGETKQRDRYLSDWMLFVTPQWNDQCLNRRVCTLHYNPPERENCRMVIIVAESPKAKLNYEKKNYNSATIWEYLSDNRTIVRKKKLISPTDWELGTLSQWSDSI